MRALRKFLRWRSNPVVCSRRSCSSADEDKVRRTCIRRRRSGGMEPVAVLRSQLSVLGQFQDGAEDIFLYCWHLTLNLILMLLHALYERLCTSGALESVVVLWRLRSHRNIIVIITIIIMCLFKVYSAFHPSVVDKWVPVIAGKAKAGMAHSDCGWTCGCAGKTVKSLENTCHTWTLLRWWFTTKRRYIKCPAPLKWRPYSSLEIW